MKLAEFLNDDTCQILLAIIVGIVICYFIFGSCSSGSCNRDGFSVGGQACNTLTPAECCGGTEECIIVGTTSSSPQCTPVDNTNDFYCFSELPGALSSVRTSEEIREQQERDAGSEYGRSFSAEATCEAMGGVIYRNNNPSIIACPERPAGGGDGSAAGPPPAPPTQSEIESVKYSEILKDMIKAIRSLSVVAGTDSATIDSIIQGEYEPTRENFNAILTMANTKNIFFQLLMNDHTTNSDSATVKAAKGYDSQQNSIMFTRPASRINIITNDNSPIEYITNRLSYSPQVDENLVLGDLFGTYAAAPRLVKHDLYCEKNTMTINSEGIEKIDPLLKMKSDIFLNNRGYAHCSSSYFYDSCREQLAAAGTPFMIPEPGLEPQDCEFSISTSSPPPVRLPAGDDYVANQLRQISAESGRGSRDDTDINNLVDRYNANRVYRRFFNRNNYEIIIDDVSDTVITDSTKFTGGNPFTELIHIQVDDPVESSINFKYTSDGVNIATDESATGTTNVSFRIPAENLTLLKAYGMSQLADGVIYNNKYNNAGNDTVSQNIDRVNNYFTNLLQIQYLITKIIIGTDRYLGENLNIYNKDAASGPAAPTFDGRDAIEPGTTDYYDNQMCKESGRDWLLLVYKQKPTVERGSGGQHGLGGSFPTNCDPNSDLITDDIGIYNAGQVYNIGINNDGQLCFVNLSPTAGRMSQQQQQEETISECAQHRMLLAGSPSRPGPCNESYGGGADDCCTAVMAVPQKCNAYINGLTEKRASCTTSSAATPAPAPAPAPVPAPAPAPDPNTCLQGVYDCERIYDSMLTNPSYPPTCDRYYDITTLKLCQKEKWWNPGKCDFSDTDYSPLHPVPDCVPRN